MTATTAGGPAGGPAGGERAELTIDPAFRIGSVDPRLYGSFVEHLGRCVYTGLYEPGHPTADGNGLRRDVVELVRELGVRVVRYPGGNFVSAYRWEDGVGPVGERPVRLDPAWHTTESNEFGLGEFMTWLGEVGAEPMLALNLGTRGVAEACDLLEYANHPAGTRWSDLRVEHGARDPYRIRLWCLGNELDGPWQVGHKTAEEYGRLAAETARAMRMVQPGLELVACGSSHAGMPTFGTWEATVLEHAYDHIDYLSLHAYYQQHGDDAASFLASGAAMESFIDSVVATCDHLRATLRASRPIHLSFDEWNVWYQSRFAGGPPGWDRAPRLLEDRYSLTDAVVVGSLLIALLRHCDRVRIACQAQLVNVIAPIVTEPGGPAWRQSTFHPFAQAARYGHGEVLRVEPSCPVRPTERHGEVPLLHATATLAEDATVTLFAVNRSPDTPLALDADLRALGTGVRVLDHQVLADADPAACNTREQPDRVRPRPATGTTVEDGHLRALLPPVSWHVVRIAAAS